MRETERKWIDKGYETFAVLGSTGLKVEQLAKEIGISKSSFYHHFVDIEYFIEQLLEQHLHNSKIIAEKEQLASTIQPELVNILLDHKIDLLFNRQLRIHASNPKFKATLQKSNAIIGQSFIQLWLTDTQLNITQKQASAIVELALENFFLQINFDNLQKEWLNDYFDNLKRITQNFLP